MPGGRRSEDGGNRQAEQHPFREGGNGTASTILVHVVEDRRFCELFVGVISPSTEALSTQPRTTVDAHDFKPELEHTVRAIQKLAKGKGVGPDKLPAELWIAGGVVAATWLHELNCRVIMSECPPVAWKGGRITNLAKAKGDPKQCSSSRG